MTPRAAFWAGILLAIALISISAPLIAPADPLYAASGQSLRPPSVDDLLGTDLIGRDVLSRLLYGGRQSLFAALLATILSVVPGGAIGLVIGYFGGLLDTLIGVLLDALLAFPALLLALAIVSLLGNGVLSIALAVGLAGFPTYARVARSAARVTRGQPYIEAAKAIGASPARILLFHVLPNAAPTVLAFAGVIFSWALLNDAALAFLGFTGDPATPDWGVMLAAGRQTLIASPWQALAAGGMLTLTVLAVNQLIDALDL